MTAHGIFLIQRKNTFKIPWDRYKVMRGGPNLLICYKHNAKTKCQPIGIFPNNLELVIADFASQTGRYIKPRPSASDQVPAFSMLPIAGMFVLIAALAILYS